MKIRNHKLISISFTIFIVILVLACSKSPEQKMYTISADSIENRFFRIDFEKNTYEMSDIENHFFTTFPHNDPTLGNVIYDRKKWINKDILKLVNGDGLYLYIKDRNDNKMFDSFRLTSKSFFNLNEKNQKFLFVFKGKLPSGKGIWPAWWLNGSKEDAWTYKKNGKVDTDNDLDSLSGKGHFYDTQNAVNGTDWPGAGEIDIIETINGNNIIHNTIHTCPQMCDSKWNSDGKIINCANAKIGDPNAGCSGKPYKLNSPEGTFACLLEKNIIKFFYWTPSQDVRKIGGPLSKKPNPDQWVGKILKNEVRLLETDTKSNKELHQEWQCNNCESANACVFTNMKMIFNITLCGKWAGRDFDETNNSNQNCRSYVLGEGRDSINNQFLKIEYVSAIDI